MACSVGFWQHYIFVQDRSETRYFAESRSGSMIMLDPDPCMIRIQSGSETLLGGTLNSYRNSAGYREIPAKFRGIERSKILRNYCITCYFHMKFRLRRNYKKALPQTTYYGGSLGSIQKTSLTYHIRTTFLPAEKNTNKMKSNLNNLKFVIILQLQNFVPALDLYTVCLGNI
jgi:hypothetical protein